MYKNWIEVKLKSVLDIKTGRLDANAQSQQGEYPFFTCAQNPLKIDRYSFDQEAVLLGGNGDFSLNVYKGKFDAYQRTYVLSSKVIDYRFLYYLLRFNLGRITENNRGSTVKYIRKGDIENIKVRIPVSEEQIRIADKLDVIFDKIDFSLAKTNKVKKDILRLEQSFINYVASCGSDDSIQREEFKLIDLILNKPRNGYSPKTVSYETKVKSLSLSATTAGYFKPEHYKNIDEDISSDSHLWLKNGDILIQRSNSLEKVGTAAIYTGKDYGFIYPDLMMKIQVKEEFVDNEFLWFCLSSSTVKKYFISNATGTAGNMPKINQGIVSNTPIKLPCIDTQREMIARYSDAISSVRVYKSQVKFLENKVNLLSKSVLKKAFEGKLVENSEESVDELLKKIEELNHEITKKVTKKKTTTTQKSKGKAIKSKKTLFDDDLFSKLPDIFTEQNIKEVYGKKAERIFDFVMKEIKKKNGVVKQSFDKTKNKMIFKKVK